MSVFVCRMMTRQHSHDPGRGAENLTTLVSVSLLLLIAGIAGILALAGSNESARLRESLELTLVMRDSVTDARAAALAADLRAKPYVAEATVVTRDRALDQWQQATGDDLRALYGVNPLSPEVTLRLRAGYSSPQQIRILSAALERMPEVEGVAQPQAELVDGMNRTLHRIIWGLAALCAGMVVISLVLINNMVHLGIYSRRFAIRTMQLVGATDAFVRRPFLVRHALIGFCAAALASTLLVALVLAATPVTGVDMQQLLPWSDIALIVVCLLCFGIGMCTAAAWFSTRRHLRARTGDLFA